MVERRHDELSIEEIQDLLLQEALHCCVHAAISAFHIAEDICSRQDAG